MSRRLISIESITCLYLLSHLTLAAGCEHHRAVARPVDISGDPPRPASLVQALSSASRPYNERYVNSLIGEMRRPGGQKIEADQRDAEMRELARLVEVQAKQVRLKLMCVETLNMSPGLGTSYDRAVMFFNDEHTRPFGSLRPVCAQAVDSHRWQELRQTADTLLTSTASHGPESVIFDSFEAMVISLYDGSGWKSSTWLYLSSRTKSDPERPEDLSAETRAAINLIQLLNLTLADTRKFAPEYTDMVEKFGEYRSGGTGRPPQNRK